MSSPERESQCGNCGASLQGRWCSLCGQKVLSEHDRRFRHVLGQFAHELLHIDGKLLRTLGALLFRPGLPSQAYLDGRRVAYLSPIGLFLLINLLYFLAPPMTDFNITLYDQYHLQPYSALLQPLIDMRLDSRGIEFDDYAEQYNRLNLNLARSLIILHLPLLALALKLMLIRRPTYFAEHFIVATHLFSFLLLLALLLSPISRLILWLGRLGLTPDLGGLFRLFWSSLPLVIVTHWLLSARRCYRLGWIGAVAMTLGLALATVIVHFVFRLVQFLAVFAAT